MKSRIYYTDNNNPKKCLIYLLVPLFQIILRNPESGQAYEHNSTKHESSYDARDKDVTSWAYSLMWGITVASQKRQ